jgi:hypothetical protein
VIVSLGPKCIEILRIKGTQRSLDRRSETGDSFLHVLAEEREPST